jgi:hypothetical protein
VQPTPVRGQEAAYRRSFNPARLRHGEILAGAAGLILLVVLFAVPWYGLSATFAPTAASLGVPTSSTGWSGLTTLRWLLLLTAFAGLALAVAQAACRGPALPSCVAVVVIILGFLSTVALIIRVGLDLPGPSHVVERRAGAFIGLGAAVVALVGGYRSLRQEGIMDSDGPREIPTVAL